MQLSQNRKMFSEFFLAFPKSTQHFEYFEKKDDPQMLLVCEIIVRKNRGYLNV